MLNFLVIVLFSLSLANSIDGQTPAQKGFVDITQAPYYVNTTTNTPAQITTQIQTAINDLAINGGGTLYFPNGLYKVLGNIQLKSGIIIEGTNGFQNSPAYGPYGCKIYLDNDGAQDAQIFLIGEGVRKVAIRNIALTSNIRTRAKAIYASGSALGLSSQEFLFHNLTIYNFAKAIEVQATDDRNDWQFEGVNLDHCSFYENDNDITLNSNNTEWLMSNSLFGVNTGGIGILIERSGFLSIEHCLAAGPPGAQQNPSARAKTFLWIKGPHATINIHNSQSEAFQYSMQIDAENYTGGVITLVNNIFGDTIQIRANTSFVSLGNQYHSNTVQVINPAAPSNDPDLNSRRDNAPGANHAIIYSYGDLFDNNTTENVSCSPPPGSPIPFGCKRDFYLNNFKYLQLTPTSPDPRYPEYPTGFNNRVNGRTGEKGTDFNYQVRIGRQSIQASPNVLLNLSAQRPGEIPLRIGGSRITGGTSQTDEFEKEGCRSGDSDCYYEVRRDDGSINTANNPLDPYTLGFLEFRGAQTNAGPTYTGFKFNGPLVPFVDPGSRATPTTSTLGTPNNKWAKIYAVEHIMGDAILSDRKTGKELYRIREDEKFIYFEDIRSGKLMMKLDINGNLHLAGRIIEQDGQTARKAQKPISVRKRRSKKH